MAAAARAPSKVSGTTRQANNVRVGSRYGPDDTGTVGLPEDSFLTDNTILSPIISFAQGAYSFPYDWWLAIHWVLGMQGLYGERMQRNCHRAGRDSDLMLNLAVRGFPHS